MSDLFRSAFGYFGSGSSTTSPSSNVSSEFVGQVVEIGSTKWKIKRTLGTGGYAFVYVAQALDTGKEYALKRMIAADDEARQAIVQEVNILKKVSDHPNIIQYVNVSCVERGSVYEYMLVTELCTGGNLVEVLQRLSPAGLPPEVVTKVMWQCCKAVHHMHSQSPSPIIHRDLKIENLLLSAEGKVKLCDFGSATTQIFRPDNSWSAQQRSMLEDQLHRRTTPMYRAPEMVDLWQNSVIGPPADLWALGCLLYLICYGRHPFEDSGTLRIINGNYSIPANDGKYRAFHSLINGCLKVHPSQRMSITEMLDILSSIAETQGIDASESLELENILPNVPTRPAPPVPGDVSRNSPSHQPLNNSRSSSPSQRPLNPPTHHQPAPPPATSGGSLFSQIRGGAGSFLRNLKDTSSKVVQSVQLTMVRGEEMAFSYITMRICVVNYTDGPDTLHDLRLTIEARHPLSSIALYNLSSAPMPTHRFPNATIVECGWSKKCPSLQAIYTLCEHMHHFLSSHQSNVAFIVCNDGKRSSPLLVSAFLLYVGFATRPQDALQLYAVKRTTPNLQPSHLRYLDYFSQVLSNPQPTFSCHKVRLMSVMIQPVPLFNKNRDGCRPYIDIYQGEDKVFTTLDEYDRMVVFTVAHGKVVLPIRCNVSGDVTILINHSRQVLTRITPINMLKIQFNTAFTHDSTMLFSRGDVDDAENNFDDSLLVTLNSEDAGEPNVLISPWAKYVQPSPSVIFTSKLEQAEITESFVSTRREPPKRPAVPPPRPIPPRPPSASPARHTQHPSPRHLEETEDLLNLNSSSSTVEEEPTSHSPLPDLQRPQPTTDSSSAVVDDLLNLGLSEPPCQNSQTPIFEPFSDDKHLNGVPPPTNTANLLGDWSSSLGASNTPNTNNVPQSNQPTFADFITNLSPTSAGGPTMQRNVSSPNLHNADLLEDFVVKPKAMSNASSPSKGPPEPNYNRSHFEQPKPTSQNPQQPTATAGTGPRKLEDAFGDLLGSQGYSFSSKKDTGPRTMNQMRRVDQVKVTDPEKLKILDWTEGKTNNIRALLTSLHTILWPEAKWSQCYMHQLITAADVKKAYRRACIAVHPDKHIGTENENIAKMIFMELNNAWCEFEKESG